MKSKPMHTVSASHKPLDFFSIQSYNMWPFPDNDDNNNNSNFKNNQFKRVQRDRAQKAYSMWKYVKKVMKFLVRDKKGLRGNRMNFNREAVAEFEVLTGKMREVCSWI